MIDRIGDYINRRAYLRVSFGSAALVVGAGGAPGPARPIELLVDLQVDPAREKEMLEIFHGPFHTAAAKQPGFISAQMLKLRSALQGSAPTGANYRFALQFQSEEQRQAWISSALHKQLWPKIEATLSSKNYTVLLYDIA
jgi:antibiotic biosynthesis monooxygenase (ABM) superfamily enzyme